MHQGKPLVLYYCNNMFLILLFIQLSIFLGNWLLHSKGTVQWIVKYWLLLRASVISVGTLWVVLFVFGLIISHLSFSLVSQTLVADNFWWAAFLVDFLPGLSLVYTKGKDHVVPDALSYLPASLTALSFVSSLWLSSLSAAQEGNSSLGGPIWLSWARTWGLYLFWWTTWMVVDISRMVGNPSYRDMRSTERYAW